MADLRQLVLMLSSTFDGEVVNAARAIDRHLKNSGTDWHKFADKFVSTANGASSGYTKQASNGYSSHKAQYEKSRDADEYITENEVYCLSQMVDLHKHSLNTREITFLCDMQERVAEWGARTYITPKQRAWLHIIMKKCSYA